MPFFLPSKPPAKTTRAKVVVPDKTKGGAPAVGPPAGSRLAWLWPFLGLLLCAGLGAGWFFGTRALHAQFVALHPAPTGAKAIHMDAFRAAPWVTPNDIADLTREMGELLTADPLDGECLQQVARRLEAHLSIRKVTRVYRDDEGLVRIEALAYQPAGLVPVGELLSPVDAEGHLLSAEGLSPEMAATLPIPRIEGVKTASPYGKAVWRDAGLQAALRLVLRLTANERRALRQISLGEEPGSLGKARLTLTLHFEPPSGPPFEVFWGLPIGEERGVDAPADDKLKALRDLYTRPDAFKNASPPRFSIRSGGAKLLTAGESPAPPRPAGKPRTP